MGQLFRQTDVAGIGACNEFECTTMDGDALLQARRHRRCAPRAGGFTLVELMVVIAVAAVLLVVAVPSFKSITISNKLNTAVNDLVGSLNTARMEAIKANANSQFCSNSSASNTSDTLGAECSTQTVGAVALVTGSSITVVRAGSPVPAPLIIKGSAKAVRFAGDGIGHEVGSTAPYTGTVADICTSSSSKDNHRTIKMTAGAILETSTSSGACQ